MAQAKMEHAKNQAFLTYMIGSDPQAWVLQGITKDSDLRELPEDDLRMLTHMVVVKDAKEQNETWYATIQVRLG